MNFLHQFQGFAFEFLKLAQKKDNNLTDEEYNALKELAKNKNVIVTKADKGNAVVIMDKQDYRDKILKLIDDKKKFKLLESDPTIKRENSLLNTLSNLKKQKIISDEIFKKIRPTGSRPGIIYGLPKIHKSGYPLRPIISSSGTYNYNLSKFIDGLIKPLRVNSKYILNDTFDFINKLSKVNFAGMYMVSFDVESLFTNIPLEETIDILCKIIFDTAKTFHGFTENQFRKLLKKATKESHFQFIDMVFDQIDGMAMGNPLSPTFANFFMNWFECKYMKEFEALGVVTWFRYVDDTFVLIKDLKVVDQLLNLMNSKHKNIKFTCEIEKNKKLAFLDVLVNRKKGGFITTMYRKPTFTGVYLHWKSLTAVVYKINLIKCLLDRAWKICSNYELFHQEILLLKEVLKKNDYPSSVIDKQIDKFLNKKLIQLPPKTNELTPKKKIYLVLPYFNDKMDDFKRRLTDLIYKYYPNVDFRLMFTPPSKIANLFPFKDKTPFGLQSLVVYKIGCLNCSDFYVGKTARCLIRRIDEHKKGVGTDEYKSALYKHSIDHGHTIDYENVEILGMADSDRKLLLKEMLFINKLKPTLNTQKNSCLFSLIIGKNT